MSSHLRLQSSFEPVKANARIQTSPTLPPAKKQKMSLTQTYYVASTARSKLGQEAGRADHNLRLLVGHANLLDSLMVELADAEREQEAWFNLSVNKASKQEQPRHVQWIDAMTQSVDDDEDDDDDSDLESDIYDEDLDMFDIPLRNIRSPPIQVSSVEIDEDMESDDEFDDDLALSRVSSNQHAPPELDSDSDSDSEDDMPASPEQPLFELSEKERQQIATTTFYGIKASSETLLAQRNQQPMIAAC